MSHGSPIGLNDADPRVIWNILSSVTEVLADK